MYDISDPMKVDLTSNLLTSTFTCNRQHLVATLLELVEGRMIMINHHKVWDQARMKLASPGSAVRLATDCVTGPCHKNH